jgi:hypothetical protein
MALCCFNTKHAAAVVVLALLLFIKLSQCEEEEEVSDDAELSSTLHMKQTEFEESDDEQQHQSFLSTEIESTTAMPSLSYFNSMANITKLQELSKLSHNILIYYSLFVVIVGTVLNLLSFACFYRMKKRNSQNIYLGALSLADFFNIQINILVPMLLNMQSMQGILKKGVPKAACIVYGYLVEVGLLMPVWIMVVLAAERFCSIIWPLKKNVFSTRRHAKLTLFILLCIILVWSLFKIKTPGKLDRNNST